VNVETKEKPKQWMHTRSPNKPKNLNKHSLPARKLMAVVFWNWKGVLMMEFMQQGTTITSKVYCKTLKKLCRAIQNKKFGMLTYGVVLLHDSVHLHTYACTRALLEHFSWELFEHRPYSADLAPSDYLFTYLKNWLGSCG
jgi:histone-lysine N-methyltransferase SETMAR